MSLILSSQKTQSFLFLMGSYFLMDSSIDMNVGMFWETSVGFLKSLISHVLPKYNIMSVWMLKVAQNQGLLKNRGAVVASFL